MFPFFFFNDTATTEIYTLSLHDALPILGLKGGGHQHSAADLRLDVEAVADFQVVEHPFENFVDRKSTRLNSSHGYISYAVFCLKKKKHILFQTTLIYNHLPK